MATQHAPEGLAHARHVELRGRGVSLWLRRLGMLLATVLAAAALLDRFGQHASARTNHGPQASLTVDSPQRVRGGLTFTTKFVIRPHVALADAQLRLDEGWFEGMTFNGLSPQPGSESSDGRWQVFDYGPLDAGAAQTIWVSWQTEPTAVGQHRQDAAVFDGDTRLVSTRRDLTIFP
jgi:hypothetical protein